MRLRNLKNKEDIINNCDFVIKNIEENKGKWRDIFNNNNPIYIEIGMGMGKFIYENALKNPNINYIGIEKFDNVLARAIKGKEKLNNLFFVRMDAKDIDLVFDKEIDKIFLNFSDPWHKKCHSNRRLTSSYFLNKYENIVKDRVNIIQKTDNMNLFIFSIESFSACGFTLKNISFDLHKDKDDIITTEYEDKFVKKGNVIYYLEAYK